MSDDEDKFAGDTAYNNIDELFASGKFFDPRIKLYDPFGEYNGHDDEQKKEQKKQKDAIDRFWQENNFYRDAGREVYHQGTNKYRSASSAREQTSEPPAPQPKPPAQRPELKSRIHKAYYPYNSATP